MRYLTNNVKDFADTWLHLRVQNAGKIMVLEGGLKYQGVTMNPEDAQMLESRFSIEEICRWFRVPPFMVGHTTKQSSRASSLAA